MGRTLTKTLSENRSLKKGVCFLAGFTLVELFIALLIISILGALSYPRFIRMAEIVNQREAQVTLRLMAAAERTIQARTGAFVSCDDQFVGQECNVRLGLNLSGNNWLYTTVGVPPFAIVAVRNGGSAPYFGTEIWLGFDGTWNPPPGCIICWPLPLN